MQISTKTLASLLVVTSVAVMPGTTRRSRGWRKKSRFDRLLQRHDRKGELRAELLGLSPQEFRDLQKEHSFEEVVRRHGFMNEQAFRMALLGKLREELRQRGWSAHRINTYVALRRERLG
jgi:hypothetical protein